MSDYFLLVPLLQEEVVKIPVPEGLIPVPTVIPFEGAFIGSLRTRQHGVSGDVYALDERTIRLEHFNFDGSAPGK